MLYKQILSSICAACIAILTIQPTTFAIADDTASQQLIYRTSVRSGAVDRPTTQFITNVYAYANGEIQIDVFGYNRADTSSYAYVCQIGDIRFNDAYITMTGYENKLPNTIYYETPRVAVSFDGDDTIYTLQYTDTENLTGLNIESFYLHATELGLNSNPEITVMDESLIIPFSDNITEEQTPEENDTAMYKLPMTCDLYIDKGNGLGDYYELNASLLFTIDADGKILYSLCADEDFTYTTKSECKFTIKSDGIQVKYDAPAWCNYPRQLDKYNDMSSASMMYSSKYQLYDGCYMDVNTSDDKLNTTISYNASGTLPINNMIRIKKGDKIGAWRMSPESVIYTTEQGELFVRNPDGTKNYFSDTISLTINGKTISKEIGNKYDSTNPVIFTEADVNDDGAIDVADAVLLQKWLLAVPDTKLPIWQAADMDHDNVLNVFDLCLLKRKLVG